MKNKFSPKEQHKSRTWISLIFIFISLIFLLFILVREIFFSFGTNPKDILSHNQGEFIITLNKEMSFQEYYNLSKPTKEKNLYSEYGKLKINYTLNSPKLEFDYRFYDYQEEYYLPCEGKKIVVNFSNPTSSIFQFNYSDMIFKYKMDLYPDLYSFSDNLKNQDCYFNTNKYAEGFLEDPYNNDFIDAISKNFISLKERGFSNDEIVEITTLFVQSIPYGTDYTKLNRYPYETIYENEGNCLDKSLILVGILRNLGYTSYLILGYSGEDYHALVGLVCDKGNVNYQNQEICFVETTIFAPISLEENITIEKYIKISNGSSVYFGVNYGRNLIDYLDSKGVEIERIESKLDSIDLELIYIEDRMCDTNCVVCLNGFSGMKFVDWEKSESISFCGDANEFNALVGEYNDKLEEYNLLINDWYKVYYDLEKSTFWNVELLKNNS